MHFFDYILLDFKRFQKAHTHKPHKFYTIPQTSTYPPLILIIIFKSINAHKNIHISPSVLTIIFKSNSAYKNNHTNPKQYYGSIMGINIFMIFEPFNQANKHNGKYIITARYFFSLQSTRMSEKSINFDGKKIEKSDFHEKKTKKYLI